MIAPQKIARQCDDGETPFSHAAVYEPATTSNGVRRIVAGVPEGDPEIFRALTACLDPPYFVLYVLHTPRDEAQAGHYQSPSLSKKEFDEFPGRYSDYFRADSRYDIWSRSPNSGGAVVSDRHKLMFAYGPLELYARALRVLGYSTGSPSVDFAHVHFYREEYDDCARSLLDSLEWDYKPLQSGGEQ